MSERTAAEDQRLLEIAHDALAARLAGRTAPSESELFPDGVPDALALVRGVFVTWKKRGELRGCIGYTEGHGPLWQLVRDLAVTAAMNDRRFSPVSSEEAPALTLSISVLTPPAPIAAADVEVGRHGLIVERGGKRGLLLPQVPVEWKWDRETFLRRTCRKAGLPETAWQEPDAKLLSFEASVFGQRLIADG